MQKMRPPKMWSRHGGGGMGQKQGRGQAPPLRHSVPDGTPHPTPQKKRLFDGTAAFPFPPARLPFCLKRHRICRKNPFLQSNCVFYKLKVKSFFIYFIIPFTLSPAFHAATPPL
jgi:hypothetical protein